MSRLPRVVVAALVAVGAVGALARPAAAAPSLDLSTTCLVSGSPTPVRIWVDGQTEPTRVVVEGPGASGSDLPSGSGASYSGTATIQGGAAGSTVAVRVRAGDGTETASRSVAVRDACPRVAGPDACLVAERIQEMRVSGSGFEPGSGFVIDFDPRGSDQVRVVSGSSGSFDVTMRVRPSRAGTFFVMVTALGNVGQVASTTVRACAPPPPPPTTAPRPAPTSRPPATAPPTTASPPAAIRPEPLPTPVRPAPRPAPRLPVGTSARLAVQPTLGPPGSVVTVVGTGFPARAPLLLRWSEGPGEWLVTAGPDGRFSSTVLVLPRDRPGPRSLEVAGANPAVSAAYLVVPGRDGPGGRDAAAFMR